ncbi:interleukin-1 family member A [Silurus asotus]|uniref:Interleukin-1 beta n=1 Tax=Silurus asotus TaxID=30991 RepID=A0AAD5B766_SILAS|nr:interleukin-1 family member A [Silurus asotus]
MKLNEGIVFTCLQTLHQASVDDTEIKCPESEKMKPYHKEDAELSFSLEMVREKCLDEDEKNPRIPGEWECNDRAFDPCNDEKTLIVSMTNTSIAIVQARGCDALSPCRCGNTNCTFSDVIMATQQSAITSVCREYMKKRFERGHVFIQSLLQKSICMENISRATKEIPCLTDSTTANITIFYYMSNALDDFDKGVPVVLNFSGSTNFLKCMRLNDRPVLTVELSLYTDGKMESMCCCLHLQMVQMPHFDYGKNLSESDESDQECITTEDECAVDGNGPPHMKACFLKYNESEVLIQSLFQINICPENIKSKRRNPACMKPSTSGDITLYYYKSSITADMGRGVPVALNISNSNQFLKCEFQNGKAVLSVDCCENSLDVIYRNDPTTWPFIFYLTHTKDDLRHFESVECKGWFIHAERNLVCMDKQKDKDPEKFSFLIYCSPNVHPKPK